MTEPDSNSTSTEQLATRLRRVVGRRFRRDAVARPESAPKQSSATSWSWTAQGYDFLVISLAIFIVAVLILNMSVAGSWRERGNQWGDRARWQRELHDWEQQLAQQEQQLELECQRLAATLIARRGPEDQQRSLDQISNLRQRLRAASQSLGATIRAGNSQSFGSYSAETPDRQPLSSTDLKNKREQLIEQQYAARVQYNAEHPALQAIEHQLEEVERQLASADESPNIDFNTDSDSRVQVIQNQFLRNASNSSQPRTVVAPNELVQQIQVVEQHFDELRQAADVCLRDTDQQYLGIQQSDLQRATAWEQVANSLRAMARECALPDSLQTTVAQQDELRSEPTIRPWNMIACLVVALGIGGGIVWHSRRATPIEAGPTNTEPEKLSVNLVTKHLGCAPGAIMAWDMLTTETNTELAETPTVVPNKTLQQKLRFTSECLVATTIAVTLLVALTHGQFGDWLAANPLTAWGHLWGS